MEDYEKTLIPVIESLYGSFTALEKKAADFFIHNTERMDFSAKHIAGLLYVSEATLSRFAKKCGFKGYREFIFQYEQNMAQARPSASGLAKQVLNCYQDLLNKTYALLDEGQVGRIVEEIARGKRMYIYGCGSSGLAGMEMKLRFMRLGVHVEAITDIHIMKMNSVLLDGDCLAVGISVSGRTEEVLRSLKAAKQSGAFTVLMTSSREKGVRAFCDEVLLLAAREHLENGKAISPQFPILVMIDSLYSRLLQADRRNRERLHEYTLDALSGGKREG